MKAIVIHKAKDVRVEDRDISAPAPDEVQVAISTGGICGSDLHYYNHGGFGSVRLKEPMILGHEVAGTVTAVGDDASTLSVGDLVAVSPSRPCYSCTYCRKAEYNHCMKMRFYGSAMPFPHIQGAFREIINAKHHQCVVANGISASEAAMAEPFSVALHAVRQAGELLGKSVLISGSGPIGALTAVAARRAGATEIVVTDLADNALQHAHRIGADETINVQQNPAAIEQYTADKGYFDVHFECSGAEIALRSGIAMTRPRGVIVQLGLSGDMTLPLMQLTAKELRLCGSFRFHAEFETAIELMTRKLVDVTSLVTHTYGLDDVQSAFETANDRSVAMKTLLQFA